MEFKIFQGSVVNADVDAIVNAANNELLYGGGVCGAIFEAAGFDDLQEECELYEYCETGKAVLTHGYKLKAKYIIHAVGPVYYGNSNAEEELRSAYLSALKLADENNLESIAFPCLSTGIFGYPIKEATRIAIKTVMDYVPVSLKKCYFYCYKQESYFVYEEILNEILSCPK